MKIKILGKKSLALVISAVMVFSVMAPMGAMDAKAYEVPEGKEIKGLWIGFPDFDDLGFNTSSETTFRKNVDKMLNRAKAYKVNTIYFHTRAFRDATYRSETYRANKQITSKSGLGTSAFSNFDPLEIMIEKAHSKNMELHAWINPYRISYDLFLDPNKESSTSDIINSVKEVMDYGVDGIHFDDYFYHSSKYYTDLDTGKRYAKNHIPASAKMKNCNIMIKKVRAYIKDRDDSVKFGISPAGNLSNCNNAGANVQSWLSKDIYVDYVIPQIYWTNNWSSKGNVTMFTDRMNQFMDLNTNENVDLYIGLALYRSGKSVSSTGDKGWTMNDNNMSMQIDELRAADADGFAFFSGADLMKDGAAREERINMKPQIKDPNYL